MSNDSRKFTCASNDGTTAVVSRVPYLLDSAILTLCDEDDRAVRTVRFSGSDAVEFAEAVLAAAGFNAVVVTDLPDAILGFSGTERVTFQGGFSFHRDSSDFVAGARRLLAAHRWFERHPPVDPQVQALADDLAGVQWQRLSTSDHLARVLHERGWRREQ